MKIKIKTERCIGCGLCAEYLPEVFSMGPYGAKVLQEEVTEKEAQAVVQVAEDCPAQAICFETSIEKDDAKLSR
ncbi:MAG: ferredoxin [Spirochaetales bacterium]